MATPRDMSRRLDALEQHAEDAELAEMVSRLLEESGHPELFTEALAEARRARGEYRRMRGAGATDREIVAAFADMSGMSVEQYEREVAEELARGFG